MRYTKIFIVRWADCDVNGHMRNTAYSEYAIDTRMAWLTDHGFPFEKFKEAGIGPVILREEIDYLRELHLGDTVEVDFSSLAASPDGARWKVVHELWRPGQKKSARVVVHGGWLDLAARRLTPPPEPLRAAFEALPKAEGWEALENLKPRG